MTAVIEIGVPYEDILSRQERVQAARRFQKPDRVPVLPAIGYRYLLPQIGVAFPRYFADPEVMLQSQILAQKWLMENIRTDAHSITGAWTGAWTDFENTFEAGSLGCAVEFPGERHSLGRAGLGPDGGRPSNAGGDGLHPWRIE